MYIMRNGIFTRKIPIFLRFVRTKNNYISRSYLFLDAVPNKVAYTARNVKNVIINPPAFSHASAFVFVDFLNTAAIDAKIFA